eukprot:1354898-Pleurochrysis_carterae.AAC.1
MRKSSSSHEACFSICSSREIDMFMRRVPTSGEWVPLQEQPSLKLAIFNGGTREVRARTPIFTCASLHARMRPLEGGRHLREVGHVSLTSVNIKMDDGIACQWRFQNYYSLDFAKFLSRGQGKAMPSYARVSPSVSARTRASQPFKLRS